MGSDIAVVALIFLSVLFAFFGVWLLVSQRGTARERVMSRLKGVRQVKRYELGEALQESRNREARRKERRKEALRQKAFSDIPTLDRALKGSDWAARLNGMLVQAQVPVSVLNFMVMCALLAAMGVAVSVLWRRTFDPLLALLFAALLAGAPIVYVLVRVKRRIKKFSEQLPDALDLMSSSVKSGQSMNAAVQNVAEQMPDPIGDEFRILADELSFGVEFNDALRNLMMRVNTSDVRFFTTAMMIQKETGGNMSEVLDGLQHTIRERFRILGQVKTLTAQGKLSGLIVGLLPVVLCVLIYFANPNYMSDLFTTSLGQKMVGFAAGWQLIGVFMIFKIVNIKV